ncbi:hypothetical protein GCM10027280_16450 [Micromonospora polyrhachis]|uniref:DivIVA domain-containing protein n=1 Tax=Micromonospora polyrhachis TaxID=1282883 RepID=A0A7W7SQI0_9ACTN|nr:DivIVA domain-containing protein [Micromonospora polyrhachis]MBB4958467.1 DivIVA domain-containing protein [Micromonospora polyrhachis]
MCALLRRLRGRRRDDHQPRHLRHDTTTRPAGHLTLRPWQVRSHHFTTRRRGLDPAEIRAFLHRVADELAVTQTALVAVQEENVRIKRALWAWQNAHSPSGYELARR